MPTKPELLDVERSDLSRKDQYAQQVREGGPSLVWDQFFNTNGALYSWTLLQQAEVEIRLRKALDEAKDACLERFDRLFTEKCRREAFAFLKDVVVDDRVIYRRWGVDQPIATLFTQRRFPAKVKTWLAKQGAAIPPEAIRVVSHVEHTPYHDVFTDNLYETYTLGGDAAMAEFNIPADFNMIDPRAMAFAESYTIRLSESIARRIQDEIQFAMIEGVQAGEELRLIRGRILEVWDRPIPVHVKPRIHPDTGRVLRRGYTYYLKPDNWAMLTARTEVLRWFNEGKLEGHSQMGVQYVEYQATEDHRTCPDCLAYQGEVFTIEDAHGLLPLHCRCRCTWRPIVGDPKDIMNQLHEVELSMRRRVIQKAFPRAVFTEDRPEELAAMMDQAAQNFAEAFYSLIPADEVANPFGAFTLEYDVFERMRHVADRKDLEAYVANQIEGDPIDARQRIRTIQEACRNQGVIPARWRHGEYKIVGAQR